MISTPFCTGTGFMKCVETTREEADVSVGSEVVAAAMRVMEMEDVLGARMACDGQMRASWENMSNLSLGISGTASITKSTDDRLSNSVLVDSSDLARSASSCVILDLDTSFESSLSASDH